MRAWTAWPCAPRAPAYVLRCDVPLRRAGHGAHRLLRDAPRGRPRHVRRRPGGARDHGRRRRLLGRGDRALLAGVDGGPHHPAPRRGGRAAARGRRHPGAGAPPGPERDPRRLAGRRRRRRRSRPGGRSRLLALMREGGLVGDVEPTGGFVGVAVTAVALVLVAQVAAYVAGRRATRARCAWCWSTPRPGGLDALVARRGRAAAGGLRRRRERPHRHRDARVRGPLRTDADVGLGRDHRVGRPGRPGAGPAAVGHAAARPFLGRGAAAVLATEGAARRPARSPACSAR